jgi:hypothetical protein
VSCAAGFTNCAGSCRNLTNDNAHCGACDRVCPAGQLCTSGACALSCGVGITNCSGTCRDLQSDRDHCGTCGRACGSLQTCAAGSCVNL